MRAGLRAAVVLMPFVVYLACSSKDSPTQPEAVPLADLGGGAAALASAVPVQPSANPVRPSANPVGGAPVPIRPSANPIGGSPRPVQPSAGPIPISPGSPTPTPSGSPSASPSASPSPSPTATPPLCATPGTFTFDGASQLPFLTSGGNFQGPVINVDGASFPNCLVKAVRVRVSASANDFAAFNSGWVLRFDRPGLGPIGFDLIQSAVTPVVGFELGTGCGSLLFTDNGASFAGATPPYTGAFRPVGTGNNPGFLEYLGKPPGGSFGLYPAFLGQGRSMAITCYAIELDLQ